MMGDVHALERGGSEAADGLREPLAASLGVAADSLRVTLAYRGQLADSTSIFIAGNARGQVLGAVLWSPEAVPDAVALSMAKAQAASALLPPELASRVLAPRAQGRVAGRSFALMPYCRPLSRRRPLWWLQRSTVREVVLEVEAPVEESRLLVGLRVDVSINAGPPQSEGASDAVAELARR